VESLREAHERRRVCACRSLMREDVCVRTARSSSRTLHKLNPPYSTLNPKRARACFPIVVAHFTHNLCEGGGEGGGGRGDSKRVCMCVTPVHRWTH